MLKKLVIVLVSSACCLSLVACSNHNNAYLAQSGKSAALALPNHQQAQSLDNDYPLPSHTGTGSKTPSLVPPGLDLQKYAPKKKK